MDNIFGGLGNLLSGLGGDLSSILGGGGPPTYSNPNLSASLAQQYPSSTFSNILTPAGNNIYADSILPNLSYIPQGSNATPFDATIANLENQAQTELQNLNQPTQTPTYPTYTPPGFSGDGGGGQSAESAILQKWLDLQTEAKKELSQYNAANPFNYDDYLAGTATQQATAQEEPYYQQQLGYYLSGITNQINKSTTGLRDTLSQLGTSLEDYTHMNQVNTANQVVNANEQNEQSGLGSSGLNFRQQGQAQATGGAALTNFTNQNILQQLQARHQQGFDLADIINNSNATQQQMAQQNQQTISSLANQLTQRQGQNIAAGAAALPGVAALNAASGNFNPIAQYLGA